MPNGKKMRKHKIAVHTRLSNVPKTSEIQEDEIKEEVIEETEVQSISTQAGAKKVIMQARKAALVGEEETDTKLHGPRMD